MWHYVITLLYAELCKVETEIADCELSERCKVHRAQNKEGKSKIVKPLLYITFCLSVKLFEET